MWKILEKLFKKEFGLITVRRTVVFFLKNDKIKVSLHLKVLRGNKVIDKQINK